MMQECIPIQFEFSSRSPTNHSCNRAPSIAYSGAGGSPQISEVLGLGYIAPIIALDNPI